ncbi:DNA translocase FtsK 4TM domain-containing protein [Aggregatibacter sp. oral taxon 513]|uniref:DNA translocase FtsK n=1 Tax=Aggregatibacter sp. oral taxon 513 TaxID=712150 RepID=UPI001BA5087B|nr:DNA translocase FtsK [Aggregatibacter sp. oral taxon 513]QUC06435.1 DNA translocase FtsK 4TM domain-containing protein [Aggregatibacter sp. oral taxon 513]
MIKRITEHFSPKYYLLNLLLGMTALFGFYLIIAWSGYTPLDNSWATSSFAPDTINKAGAFGAWFVDLFFVLFGYVGNVIPFMLCFIPTYLIRTKRVTSLTWTKFSLRTFGFILLLCGLTVICTLSFNNTANYLSGGVLGGWLTLTFYEAAGKFGLLVFAGIFALAGFILCSGASFIRLLLRFYQWLTMQTPPAEETQPQAEENAPAEAKEEIILVSQESLMTQAKGLAEENSAETNTESNHQLHITGLSEETTSVSSDTMTITMEKETDTADAFISYDFEQQEALPNVTIATPAQDALPLTQVPVEPKTEIQSAVDFSHDFSEREMMPTVSLASPHANAHEETLQPTQIHHETTVVTPSVSDTEEVETGVPHITPQYKPYGDSLVHPAFQQHKANVEKPTTPLPSLDLLERHQSKAQNITQEEIVETSQRIEQQLRNFNVKAKVKDVLVGPVVTRYELELDPGVKAAKVTSLDTDLARALMFRSIRVAEVIPGKPYIGIETPNDHRQMVPLRDVLDSDEFRNAKALLSMALGKDISGKPMIVDLAKMPHLLVAGTTGSGKSVGVNTMILSLLYRVKPEEVKFIMIDPKVVELSIYNDIPHLLTEVVTDMKKAANALRWCVDEMERRYQLLSALRVRNIEGFNEKIDEYDALKMPIPNPLWRPGDSMDQLPPPLEKLSYIVVVVDEFADLMMVAGKQVEELIARLAQKARAVGIHLILATQRPSVDVITGLIKANVPSRIAFTVATKIDSRTILDAGGAESLLGKGDMLYSPQGSTELVRIHGAFMSDEEVGRVVDDWKARGKPNYIDGILDGNEDEDALERLGDSSGETDELFDEVVEFVVSTGTTSISAIQRRFRVGFNRAANIMDQLEEQGIVSPLQNGKREILARGADY